MQQARHFIYQLAFSVKHKLLLLIIFYIAEQEYIVPALSWSKLYLYIMRCNRAPAMRYAVSGNSCNDILRITELIVQADESLSVSIKTVHRRIHAVESIVVTTLLVFCLMIDDRSIHLNLTCGEITLEVLHVGSGIP